MSVVAFSEEARVLMTNTTTLVRATEENVATLIGLVEDLEVRRACFPRVRACVLALLCFALHVLGFGFWVLSLLLLLLLLL